MLAFPGPHSHARPGWHSGATLGRQGPVTRAIRALRLSAGYAGWRWSGRSVPRSLPDSRGRALSDRHPRRRLVSRVLRELHKPRRMGLPDPAPPGARGRHPAWARSWRAGGV